jgi:two-component system NarL family sensor kinase
MAERHGNWARWLVPAIYAGCITAFIADLRSANELAFGVFYAPLIVTAVFHRDKRAVWVLTAIACVMVVIGSVFPDVAKDVTELVVNRALSILALLATAVFVWHARIVQEQLAEQTSRAAAAERIKTEVLTNLSQEIRAPLYAMIGVLELVAADSRPDQKAALGMVRSSGRRLVSTVDNLVDLTQLEGRLVPAEPVDLGQLMRQTAEARRPDAAARQISLVIAIPAGREIIADANPWAVRRILENKIEDAITHTPPGGRIEVSTVAERDEVSAVIATTGKWPAGAMQVTSGADNVPLNPSIMGLALSQRLARTMGARLLFSDGSDEGTTIQLRLRAAARTDAPDT